MLLTQNDVWRDQSNKILMRSETIGKELFTQNRQRLVKELKPNGLALFNSNDTMPTNADGSMPFRQNTDLFYLTGVDQEETILVVCPNFPEERYREVLFVR